jgi:hypothetical protein
MARRVISLALLYALILVLAPSDAEGKPSTALGLTTAQPDQVESGPAPAHLNLNQPAPPKLKQKRDCNCQR